jgi:hypothetical protein
MNIANLFHWKLLFFIIAVEHIDDGFSSWHESRKNVAPKIGLSDAHPFMKSRFHFLKIEEYVGIAEMHQIARFFCWKSNVFLWTK